MITTLIRLLLALHSTQPIDSRLLLAHDQIAHHACEVALYAVVAPGLPDSDDATTPFGEALAGVLCRNDPAPTIAVEGCTCTYDDAYDCDGADGQECAPWDCTGDADACDRAMELVLSEAVAACVVERTGPTDGISVEEALRLCMALDEDSCAEW